MRSRWRDTERILDLRFDRVERWLGAFERCWRPARSLLDRFATWLVLACSLAVVATLYGRSLSYAFLFDDTYDLTRYEGRSYWQILTSSEGYSYYRPIPFLVWKLFHSVQGRYDQTTLHAIPLIVHAVSGWLLYLLVRRSGMGHWAVFPALLFLTAPFHYQSVPIVGTLFHPMAGMAILASLTLYHTARSRDPGRRRTHVAALVMTAVALWSHESGIAVVALIVGLEGLILGRRRTRRPSPWLAGHVLLALLFVLAWLTVEKAPFGERTTIDELHPKALFFLQGFTYPASAQILWLRDHRGISLGVLEVATFAVGLALVACVASGLLTRRYLFAAAPLAGLGIALAASAPSMARLSWGYVENSPRLLYLVSIGAALFWGLLPALNLRYRLLTWSWRIVTVAAVLFVVGQSWRFIGIRMTMYAEGSAIVDAVVEHGETYQGQRLLVLNAPSWFAQARYEYLYGHYGIQIMPSYIGLDRVIYTGSHRAARVDARSATWNANVSGGRYPFGPHGGDTAPEQLDALLREGRELIDVRPVGATFAVRDVGRLVPGGAEWRADPAGRLGEGIWLSRARAATHVEGLTIYFSWHVHAPSAAAVDTVVEVRNDRGRVVASYTGYALAGVSAPLLWQEGDRIDDSIVAAISEPGLYTVWAGLQRVGSGVRLPAYEPSGRPLDDGLVPLGEIVVGATASVPAP
jgi:hypothetical protein